MDEVKTAGKQKIGVRPMTFFPPFAILLAFVILSVISPDTFLGLINNINNWIIKNVGWAASMLALLIVISAVVAMFSKFGDVRIGGEDAKPMLSNFAWFTIALTTTMAAGVLFWGPGEPIAHFAYPPTEIYGIEAQTPAAMKFAMETMFLTGPSSLTACTRCLLSSSPSCTTTRRSLTPSRVRSRRPSAREFSSPDGCRSSMPSPCSRSAPAWRAASRRPS